MGHAVFEFPLKEKVRNYLRVEQLLGQLKIMEHYLSERVKNLATSQTLAMAA